MAALYKFHREDVLNILRHNQREIQEQKEHIDTNRSPLNYSLAPERGMTDYYYYTKRIEEVHCYNRKDIVTMASWLVTLPRYYNKLYSKYQKKKGKPRTA